MKNFWETTDLAEVGIFLASARTAQRHRQHVIAKALDISITYLSQCENGRRIPSQGLLDRWVRLLNCTLTYTVTYGREST